jgi:kynurenine formamidase
MTAGSESGRRWSRRPEGSNWGDFGPDDQIGRLNLITPETVRQAALEIRAGLTFCLSLPLDRPGGNVLSPSRYPPVIRPTMKNGMARMNYPVSRDNPDATDLICDDAVVLHTQYSTHWDAFSHTGFMFDADGDGVPEPRYYNGFLAGEDIVGPRDPADGGATGTFEAVSTARAAKLGIEHMAQTSVQGRGVLIDLNAHLGREHVAVGYDLLSEIIEADGVEVEPGDMVCLHTGFAEMLLEMAGAPDPQLAHHACAALDGRDPRLLEWITRSGLSVIAADNFAVERFPALQQPHCCAAAPLHEHCLFKLGIHLGELWNLSPLARWLRANGRNRFQLTAPPLYLPGATGSPVTPVATV